jgi:hypothetical protein
MKETKKRGKVREYLDLVSQEDEEKAAKWVIEVEDKNVKQNKKLHDEALTLLSDERKRKFEYLKAMVDLFIKRIKLIDWPKKWTWKVGIKDDDKLHLLFKDPKGRVYGRGIKVTGMQIYDLNALHVLATQAENTIDQLTHLPKTSSGIYLK